MVSRIREVVVRKVWRIPLFVLLIIILGVSIVAGVIVSIPKSTVQDLRFEVWTDKKTYGINETITIHLKIVNPTFSQVCLNFTSAYQFDYIIFDQANNQLYRWAAGKEFIQALTKICVRPLSNVERTFNHAPEYYLLQPGMYTIRGVVVGYFLEDTTIEVLETQLLTLSNSFVSAVTVLDSNWFFDCLLGDNPVLNCWNSRHNLFLFCQVS